MKNKIIIFIIFSFILAGCSVFHYFDGVDSFELSKFNDKTSPVLTVSTPLLVVINSTVNRDLSIDGFITENESGIESIFITVDNQTINIGNPNPFSYGVKNLSDGSHDISIYCKDFAGNLSNTVNIKIYVNPSAATLALVNPKSGFYNTDNIVVSGTSDGGTIGISSIYVVLDNTGDIDINNTSKNWAYTLSNLKEGKHRITAYAKDFLGLSTAPQSVDVTIDLTKPTISTSMPAANSIVSSNFGVTGNVGDNFGIKKIFIRIDNSGDQTVNLTGNIWNYNFTGISDGFHTIYGYVVDFADNTSDFSPLVVEVDGSLPSVTITTPLNNAILNTKTINFKGTVVTTGKSPITELRYTINGINQPIIANPPTNWMTDITVPNDNNFTFNFYAVNSLGTIGSQVFVNLTVDSTPPAKPVLSGLILSDDLGSSNIDGITNKYINLTFSGTGEVGSNLQLYENLSPSPDELLGSLTIASGGSWTLSSTKDFTEGTHKIYAILIDNALNKSVNSDIFNLVIDKTIPLTPVLSGIINNSYYTSDTTFTITGEAGAAIEYSLNGTWFPYTTSVTLSIEGTYSIIARQKDVAGNQSLNSATITVNIDKTIPTAPVISGLINNSFYTADAPFTITGEAGATIEYSLNGTWFPYTSTVTLSTDGTYSIIARQKDAAGNQSPNSGTITITIDQIIPPAPVISGITNNSYYTADTPFTITGEAGATIEYSLNGTWFPYTTSVTLSIEGTYSIIARQKDVAGNQSLNSATITVTIDKTIPTAPVISGLINNSFYTADTPFTITGEAGASIEYSLNGTWFPYTSTVTLSTDGTYSIIARQKDAAGNQSPNSGTITITVDKTIPAAPTISGITNNSYYTADTPFTITGEAGATVEYSLNGTWFPYISTVTLSVEGTYNIIARQKDAAGNQSPNSATITVTIDKTIPAAPVISGLINNSFYTADALFTITGETGANIEYSLNGTWFPYTSTVTLSTDGTYSIIARQKDVAGNQSPNSATITITVDKTIPAAPTISGITNNSYYNTDKLVTITGEVGATVEYSLNGTWFPYTSAVTLSVEGAYDIIARQKDVAGNQSPNSATITVTIDKSAPSFDISTPQDNDMFATSDIISFGLVNVADNLPGGLLIEWKEGATVFGSGLAISKLASDFTNGNHTITVTVADLAGNVTAKNVIIQIGSGSGGINIQF